MIVTLPPDLTEWAQSQLDTGEFGSVEDLLREAFWALQNQKTDPVSKATLLAELQKGIQDIAAGRSREIKAAQVLSELRAQKSNSHQADA